MRFILPFISLFVSSFAYANFNIHSYSDWSYYVSSNQAEADRICAAKKQEVTSNFSQSYPNLIFKVEITSCPAKKYASIGSWHVLSWSNPDNCPPSEGVTYPVGHPCAPSTKPPCDSPNVQKEIQNQKYICDVTTPETEFFSQVFQWWCEDGDIYTYCGHEPKECIQGLTCSSPDKDKPICNPDKENCPIPEPDPETPGQPDKPILPPEPPVNPDLPPIDICETFPELCAEPENPEPPEPPVPDPDVPSDPDAPTDDKLLNEAIESNNHLTNIGEFIKSNTSKLGDLLVQNNIIGQHQLGKLNDILNKTFGGGAGGIGSTISQGNDIAKEGNEKLDDLGDKLEDIACELDDDCADKEKPTANVDCEQSIFECKGDIIQCALLKIEYENSCATGELAQLEAEMNAAFGVDNVSALVDPEELDFSDIDSKYLTNGVSFGNSACPSPETFTFNHLSGSTTIEISYEPACHFAQVAAPIHVILAWISGLLLIGRTQGAF